MPWHVRDACDCSNLGHAIVVSSCLAYVSKHTEEHVEHEDESVLGFVDPTVTSEHLDGFPVIEQPGNEHCEADADDAAQIRKAPVRRYVIHKR